MKRIIPILFVVMLQNVFAVYGKNLSAIFSYAVFTDNLSEPYIETYLSVRGGSVNFVRTETGGFRAAVEITMLFKQNDSIFAVEKYELLSPEVQDTSEVNFNFLDQQRFALPNGAYDFELHIADVNSEKEPFIAYDRIEINFSPNEIQISDIQLVESFSETQSTNILSKSGYDLIPYIVNFYPKSVEKITFYTEIYNTGTVFGNASPFLINYYLKSWETQLPLQRYTRLKREVSKDIVVLFGEISIRDLPSGNFNLVVEVKDSLNNLISQKEIFIYRSNPDLEYKIDQISELDLSTSFVSLMTNTDTLKDFIKSLYPISTVMERNFANNIMTQNDLQLMQNYFYNFWYNRDISNPEGAWLKYLSEVNKVNQNYGTRIRKGYETDRGRVYLQYGAPNSIAKNEFEPSAYPYEIWHYYKLNNQSNRRFVFYSREFATNDFELIHSDAIGEINDPRWQVKIHNRDTPSHSLDPEDAEHHWGGRLDDYYRNPR
ncbi:MAG: GWxTD domain-containing protein [Bacteroidales bacterium]|nr:GWxTD domain-containing protein [Bacteroidales bacterium]